VSRDILEINGLKDPVWAAEINLDELFEKQPSPFHFSPIGRFPTVTRDLTFIVGRDVNFQDIQETVIHLLLPFLESIRLHDRFEGASIPRGKVSLTLRFVFRHENRTLLAEDVEWSISKAVKTLITKFDIELKEGGKN